jgi:hypothetical protein
MAKQGIILGWGKYLESICILKCCHFSNGLFFSNDFTLWLMSLTLQLEEGSVDLFSKSVKEDNLEIDMDVVEKPKTIDVYVQAWQNQIWEPGFTGIFKGKDSYTKTKAFKEQRHTDLAVKRVVFRYQFNIQLAFTSTS